VHWIAADSNTRGLSDSPASQLPHGFVGERAAARNHANISLFVNVPRRNANAATTVRIFSFAGCDQPRTIRPNQARFASLHGAFDLYHVVHRNAFRDADDEFETSAHGFENGVGSEWRW